MPTRPTPTATARATPAMSTTTATTMNDDADNCPLDPNPDQADADGDGTGDACDQTMPTSTTTACRTVPTSCLPTPSGQVVNAEGCSIAQICPCDGPWQNRAAYVACVARTANDFREDGLISAARAAQDRARGRQVPLRGEVRELTGPD